MEKDITKHGALLATDINKILTILQYQREISDYQREQYEKNKHV